MYVEQHFLEITKTEERPSSWFVNNQVIQGTDALSELEVDGSLHLATHIHPLFLCIPFLKKCDPTK